MALAAALRADHRSEVAYAKAAYEWVRDHVHHSWDAHDRRPTVSASDAPREQTGLCYVKSHLLAALLRAQGIPTGLCYQRLGSRAESFMLHGLIALHISGTGHRLDPRGNNDQVDAQFSLKSERLAWPVDPSAGHIDYPSVYPTAVPVILDALRRADDALALCETGLPDRIPY